MSTDENSTSRDGLACRLARSEQNLELAEQRLALLRAELKAHVDLAIQRAGDHEDLVARLRQEAKVARSEVCDLELRVKALRSKVSARTAAKLSGERIDALARWLPSDTGSLAGLRLAGIMDEFTQNALSPSCNLCLVQLAHWREQLEEFRPQLLFVESAWHGNGGQWTKKISHPSADLREVLAWCAEHRVPTVFWNKEDPVHFDTFINTAKLFDHVFTTDLGRVVHYKTLLGHDRVYLLPFFCQPRLHNPIRTIGRAPGFCFAGAYYTRYPDRQRDFDVMIDALSELGPVVIFDRNHGKDDVNYMFPERYGKYIQGGLAYDEIDRAYKGYEFGINLNSVKQSQSMFARRVFDLMASNTQVVSNYSRGLRLMFGDLVISTDSSAELNRRLAPIMGDDIATSTRRRYQNLQALRKVMMEHTAENRLSYVLEKVAGVSVERGSPNIVVVAPVRSDSEMSAAIAAYRRQAWQRKRLAIVLAEGYRPAGGPREPDVSLYTDQDATRLGPDEEWKGRAIACFSPRNFYGPDYLTDSALALLYSQAEVVGKGAYFETDIDGTPSLVGDGRQYRFVARLPIQRAVFWTSAMSGASLAAWLSDGGTRTIGGGRCLAIDEFNYVEGCDNTTHDVFPPDVDTGIEMGRLHAIAESVQPGALPAIGKEGLGAKELARHFGKAGEGGAVRIKLDNDFLVVSSSLKEAQHKYLYAEDRLPISSIRQPNGRLEFHLVALPGLHIDQVMIFFDAFGERVGQVIKPHGRTHVTGVPNDAVEVRLGLRVLGPGVARIRGLALDSAVQGVEQGPQVGRAATLVLTNAYPSEENLYRNAFVHRRVVGYREAELPVDVFVLERRLVPNAYEYQGQDVTGGDPLALGALLAQGGYRTILVHFLNEEMWGIVRRYLPSTRVVVWLHGAEIQPWHRRAFNYSSAAEIEKAQEESEARLEFWHEIFDNLHPNLHFVFVSQTFADEVVEDYSVCLDGAYSVIHNFIDTDLFSYEEKSVDQRLKILSIRPYASRKYANDLSSEAVLLLKDKPFFRDLEFLLVGDGPLFEETVAPIRGLDNVRIERRFMSQEEIARLHKTYGVFLNPTRWDSQGVSRDEAMASGLVPITNRTSAVPEFVSDECGIMAPEGDAHGIADAIEMLVANPDIFKRMSLAASRRPREQTGYSHTIEREVALIRETLCKSANGRQE